MALCVHFLPALTAAEQLGGGVVVVLDVLRASTTIARALAAGAREVIPCGTIEEARHVAAASAGPVVLGGERGAVRIEGFDLGNSPAEYTPAAVGGRTVVFTTTNGTRAMQHCRLAARVLIGSLANRAAVCALLEEESAGDRHLLCAGTEGYVTREDVLAAGAIVAQLTEALQQREGVSRPAALERLSADDAAVVAAEAWWAADAERRAAGESLAEVIARSRGGRNLAAVGLAADVADAAALDSLAVVPELDQGDGRIRPAA